MSLLIGIVSQKGGVGKSTLARLLAREYAANGWSVKIADLDVSQSTSFKWQGRRLQADLTPSVAVQQFKAVDQLQRERDHYDLIIVDGPPHSSAGTLKTAQLADLIVLPTGLSLDDLEPAVLLAHELLKEGIPKQRIVFALCRVGDNEGEIEEARDYLKRAGYTVLAGSIPEKTAYRRASDQGRALTETRFPSLNERADELAQDVINKLHKRKHGENTT